MVETTMTPQLSATISRTVQSMEGWCTVEKALSLASNILANKAGFVVEIGVFGGRSLVPMALALQSLGRGIVYGIDPWKKEACLEGKNDSANDQWWANIDYSVIQEKCVQTIWGLNLAPHVVLLRAPSQICASLFQSPIDVLHIDGNHSEETSVRDVNLWVPKVATGGFVWIDDTDWLTTKNAQKRLAEMAVKISEVGNCHLYQKR
jgi:predicted O-methyltransferase YrrM